jgi:predicted dehydrogenase
VGSVSLSWNEKRDQKIEIEGERGTLIYQSPSMLQFLSGRGPFQPTSTLVRPGEEGRRVQLPMPNVQDFATPEAALAHMFRQIVSYLRGEEKPESVATFRDGAEVLKVIDAMVASNETGRWLEVERASEGGTVGLARLS